MRKPFLLILLLVSLWVWCLDLTDILFFYLNYHYSALISYVTAFVFFIILTCTLFKYFYKYLKPNNSNLQIDKNYFFDFGIILLCFLPVLFLNYQRIMFPDADYDVQAYHFFLHRLNRLESLKNFNLVGGAGGGTYFFTLSYKIFSLSRALFGYRLGTIINTYLIFLIYISVYDFLKQWLQLYYPTQKISAFILALSSLFIIAADNNLFNLNSYKVDLIGLPLLLEMIHILFFKKLDKDNKVFVTIVFFLLASITIAYKLTYLPYVLIIGLGFFISNATLFLKEKILVLIGLSIFFFPAIYLIYNYTETLNPIFPFYNKLFKSPLYEFTNFKDVRWGPRNIFELFFYNIITFLHKERNSEFQYFSFRLLSEYAIICVAIIILFYQKFRFQNLILKSIFYLSLISILCNYMLLYTTGYYRYGVLIEILFGIVLVLWAFLLFFSKKWYLFALLFIFMGIQSIETFKTIFIKGTNLSWYNYKELRSANNGTTLKAESKRILNDYETGVDTIIKNLKIDAFLSSDCNGFGKLLAPDIPIYNTLSFGNRQAVIDSFQKNIIDTLSQRHNFFIIIAKDNLFEKIRELNDRKYLVDSLVDIYPAFTPLNAPLYLVKIKHFNNQFKIVNKTSALRVDSNGVSKNFYYADVHKFKTFIIEDPYTYNWGYRQDSAKFYVNGVFYSFDTRNHKNKIVTIQPVNELIFKNKQDLQYFIITQSLQNTDGK